MSQLKKQNRLVWMDLLRVVATCMVPIAHLCSNVWNITSGIHSADYITLNFFNGATRWVVPVFVMISGVFFLNPNKKCDPKKIFQKNIVRMATAFAFWSFIYAVQWCFFRPLAQSQSKPVFSIKEFLMELLRGEYHMWYLYMIAALYLFTPLIRVFTDNATQKQLLQFMAFSFLFVNVIPTIMEIPALKFLKLDDLYEDFHLGFITGYTGLYVAGHYLSRYELSKKARYIIYAAGVGAYVFTVAANLWLSFKKNDSVKNFLEVEMANIVMMGFAIFVFFCYEVSKISFSEKAVKAISWLSARSFGVYLCHVLVMRAFQYFGIQVIHFSPEHATVDMSFLPYVHIPPIIGIPVLSALVIVGAFLLSWGVSKIPFINKYIS